MTESRAVRRRSPSCRRKRTTAVPLPPSWSTSQSPPPDFLLWKYLISLFFSLGMSFSSNCASSQNECAAAMIRLPPALSAVRRSHTFTFGSAESRSTTRRGTPSTEAGGSAGHPHDHKHLVLSSTWTSVSEYYLTRGHSVANRRIRDLQSETSKRAREPFDAVLFGFPPPTAQLCFCKTSACSLQPVTGEILVVLH